MKPELLYRGLTNRPGEKIQLYGSGVSVQPDATYLYEVGQNRYTKKWWSVPHEIDPASLEEFTGFVHTKTKKQIFENDVLLFEIEEDHGDIHTISIVTWVKEWAMFTLLSHSERLEYEDGGVEVLGEDVSSYLLFQEDIDVYAVNLGNKFGKDWGKYYM